jgi:GntR family transcriptional regulator / MocR family aminotransferase
MRKVPSAITPVVTVNRKSSTPLYRQIYDSFRDLIVQGSLVSGQQIPSTRTLAKELGISRFPVLNAYAQLLGEGYFEGHIGSGTVVSSSLPDQPALSGPPSVRSTGILSGPRRSSKISAQLPGVQTVPWLKGRAAFVGSQLALDQFPFNLWSRLLAFHGRKTPETSLHYGHPMGLRDLREAIASYLRTARAGRCEAEQIMIVSGSQQALDITSRVLLDPKDRVWLEEPGYTLARHIFMMAGSRLVPVPVDQEGLDVAAGKKLCAKAKAVYVCPSHQYPLGVVMSASRRLQLLNWAQSTGSWIIEDDYDSEYRYESVPIASLQGLDRCSRVVYIGTFSKVLFPCVRVGYVVIPPDLVDRFVTVRQTMDIFPSNLFQQVLSDFINEGHFERHIRRMRAIYRDRRNALVGAIRKDLADNLKALGGDAGLHLTVMLKKPSSDVAISARAALSGFGRSRSVIWAPRHDKDSFWALVAYPSTKCPVRFSAFAQFWMKSDTQIKKGAGEAGRLPALSRGCLEVKLQRKLHFSRGLRELDDTRGRRAHSREIAGGVVRSEIDGVERAQELGTEL